MIILLLLFHLSSFSANHRGTFTGNNGNVLKMIDGSVRFADVIREPGFEYYDIVDEPIWLSIEKKIKQETAFSNTTVFYWAPYNPPRLFSHAIQSTLKSLRFFLVDSEIPDKKDQKAAVFRFPGQKKPLAVQFPATNMVFISRTLFEKLNDQDQTAFFFHEALIKIWYPLNFDKGRLKSTDAIADFVEILFRKRNRPLSPRKMTFQLCRANIFIAPGNYSHYELASGSDFNTHFIAYDRENCHVRIFEPSGEPPEPVEDDWEGVPEINTTFALKEIHDGTSAEALLQYTKFKDGIRIILESRHPIGFGDLYKKKGDFLPTFSLYKPKNQGND